MISLYFKYRKEKPIIEKLFTATDLWIKEIGLHNREQYYEAVLKPTIKLLNLLQEAEEKVVFESSITAIQRTRKNCLNYFHKVSESMFSDSHVKARSYLCSTQTVSKKEIDEAFSFWKRTRIHGASASMADSAGALNDDLINTFDKIAKLSSNSVE